MSNDLHERCYANLVGYWEAMAASDPAAKVDTVDSIRIATGMELPLFNPVFIKPTATQLPTMTKDTNYSFWYDHQRNKNIPLACLQTRELIMQHVPVMSIQLDKEFKQEKPPAVEISMVSDNANLSDYIKPVQVAFQMDDKAARRYRQCLEQMQDQLVHFVVKSSEQIIGAGSVFFHEEMAGLYNLSVLPEFRKQGIATALHYARLNEARKRGYQFATLQATPMAASLDASIGFKVESQLSIYKC